jgi:phage gp45-like
VGEIMALLSTIYNALSTVISGAPGKSIQVDIETAGMNQDDAELYHLPGLYSVPAEGIKGVMLDVGDNNIIIATHDYRLNKTLDKGETLLYSIDANGVIKSSVLLKIDGEMVLNDGADYAVKYSKLESEFNKLKTSHNDLLTEYKLHTHPYVDTPVGPSVTSATVSTQIANASDITLTKVDKVRI